MRDCTAWGCPGCPWFCSVSRMLQGIMTVPSEVPRRHAHLEVVAMARSLGNVIADSLGISLSYGERMLKDVSAERFGRFACPGGVEVVSNHPAFIYGHLSLYAPKVLVQIGCPTPAVPGGPA